MKLATGWLVCSALLLSPLGASAADAPPYPHARSGLWEVRGVLNGVIMSVTQQCFDYSSTSNTPAPTPPPPKGCTVHQSMDSTGLGATSTCADGGASQLSFKVPDPDHWSFVSAAQDASGRGMKMTQDAHRIGDCPAEMRDGRSKTVTPLTDLRTGEPLAKPGP